MRLPDIVGLLIKYEAARNLRRYKWHRWYAWRPVSMKGWVGAGAAGDWAHAVVVPDHLCWFETIERRKRASIYGRRWEYRYLGCGA